MSAAFTGYYDPKTKILHGPEQKLLYHPDVSLGQVILHSLSKDPTKIIQINDTNGRKISSSEMKISSIRIAQNLLKREILQNDVIGVLSRNVDNLTSVVIAGFLIGTPVNCLDISFTPDEIKHMFAITKPKIVFCDVVALDNLKKALRDLSMNCPIYLLNGSSKDIETESIDCLLKETGLEAKFSPVKLTLGGDQTGLIMCSSGSTGLPKGVTLSHKTLLNHATSNITRDDVLLCFSSLYWFSGFSFLRSSLLNGGTRIITEEPFSPQLLLNLVEKYKVTLVLSPPSQVAQIAIGYPIKTYDLSSVRVYAVAGSPLAPSLAEKMQSYLPKGMVAVIYGMTETAGTTTMCLTKMNSRSVGHVQEGIQIKVIDESGNNLGPKQEGEICIKLPSHWSGYYGNPKASHDIYDNNGWVHSGDLGYYDELGFLYVVDRKKEIFKHKNFHIFPGELETVIAELPDVIEVCVCSLPDEINSDVPAAAIVKKEKSQLTAQDVEVYVAKKVSDAKKLRGGVHFMKELPKTPSGKILRREVKKLLLPKEFINGK